MMDKLGRWAAILLKAARAIYVVAATVCIVVAALGCAAALYFQLILFSGPKHVSVPSIPLASVPAIGPGAVDDRLEPPTNVRISPARAIIDKPPRAGEVVGYLQADTANGIASFPESFDILGGKDAALFDRGVGNHGNPGQASSVWATEEFARQFSSAIPADGSRKSQAFALTVIARDAYGVPSSPTDVVLTLTFGKAINETAVAAPARVEPVVTPPSELERLAREIALTVGREGTSSYIETYNRVFQQPNACGTGSYDLDFVNTFRRLFDHAKPKLTAVNLPAFLGGVCDVWQRAKNEQGRVLSDAEYARNAAISENQSSQLRYEIEAAAAWTGRNLTLAVGGSALGAFMIICLVLAFLAIENHSNAMRMAVAAISDAERKQRQESA